MYAGFGVVVTASPSSVREDVRVVGGRTRTNAPPFMLVGGVINRPPISATKSRQARTLPTEPARPRTAARIVPDGVAVKATNEDGAGLSTSAEEGALPSTDAASALVTRVRAAATAAAAAAAVADNAMGDNIYSDTFSDDDARRSTDVVEEAISGLQSRVSRANASLVRAAQSLRTLAAALGEAIDGGRSTNVTVSLFADAAKPACTLSKDGLSALKSLCARADAVEDALEKERAAHAGSILAARLHQFYRTAAQRAADIGRERVFAHEIAMARSDARALDTAAAAAESGRARALADLATATHSAQMLNKILYEALSTSSASASASASVGTARGHGVKALEDELKQVSTASVEILRAAKDAATRATASAAAAARAIAETAEIRRRCVALAAEASAAVDARAAIVRDAADDRRAAAEALAEAVTAKAAAADAVKSLGCARCASFTLPPAESAGCGPWVDSREVRALIDAAASLKLIVVAPTVRVAVAVTASAASTRAVSEMTVRPLLPLAPLAGVLSALHTDVLPRFTAAFTLPCLRTRAPDDCSGALDSERDPSPPRLWLDGPDGGDLDAWLKRFTAALEQEVVSALTACGGFAPILLTGERDKC